MSIFRRAVMLLCIMTGLVSVSCIHAETTTAPDVALKTTQGDLLLSQLQGQVIYVDFWASWCAPCRKSFPWMNQMQAKYGGQGLKIIAVNVDSDQALAKKFLAEHNAGFTIAYDPQGRAASTFNVKGMPHSFLIDRQGHMHSSHIGFREKDITAMEAGIKSLLAQ